MIYVHPMTVIDEDVQVGEGSKIWHFCHVSKGARIGTNCVLGQNVFIGEGVRIGNNVRIQNNVSVYSGVTIEDYVFLGPSCVFTNVKRPQAQCKSPYQETYVEKGVVVGANATIICGTRLGHNSFVGAGSVVTKDVPPYVVVIGNPAKLLNSVEV